MHQQLSIKYLILSCSYGLITGINHIYINNNFLINDDKKYCLMMKICMSPLCFPLYLYNDVKGDYNLNKYSHFMDYILVK
jgi:hypothetical protein